MKALAIASQLWVLVLSVSCGGGSDGGSQRRHGQMFECGLDSIFLIELVIEELQLSAGSYKTSDSLFHDPEVHRLANAVGINSTELSDSLTDPWGAAYIVDVRRGDDGSVVTTVTSEGPTRKKGDGYLHRATRDGNGNYSFETDRKY